MTGRVPVLRENNVLEVRGDLVNRRDHSVTFGNSKRSAGAKIVLDVDDNQNVACVSSQLIHLPGVYVIFSWRISNALDRPQSGQQSFVIVFGVDSNCTAV